MEVSVTLADIEDARDLFLLAKDRLLDVNDWGHLFPGSYNISLTDRKGRPLHRSAHVDDMIYIAVDNGSGMWISIRTIQYDLFPDIESELISMLLQPAHSPSGLSTGAYPMREETILIKRESTTLTAHCNAGNELPESRDRNPNAHLNTDFDLHPALNILQADLQGLLKGLITVNGHG
ncbi:MAG TPA: hypothetical protein VEB40_09865 [Flavipsychrobacter sp.]|nr:hypothetical protein [Flavipsychrobacter sp.]